MHVVIISVFSIWVCIVSLSIVMVSVVSSSVVFLSKSSSVPCIELAQRLVAERGLRIS